MNLTFLRHGETNYNVSGLVNADPNVDVHLTENGVAQVRHAGELLADCDFDVVYISELPRTKQTAECLGFEEMPTMITDARLNDIVTGFEGQYHEIYDAARSASSDPFSYRHGDGESLSDVYVRVESFLDDLGKTGYSDMLIITSEIIIVFALYILDHLSSEDAKKIKIKNAEFVRRSI